MALSRNELHRAEIEATALAIIAACKEAGINVMRYDAYTSNSVYLKLDDGVLGSVRISDHPTKNRDRRYKYNLTVGGKRQTKTQKGVTRNYFPIYQHAQVMKLVLDDYDRMRKRYGFYSYLTLMAKNRAKSRGAKGFWSKAKYV